MSALSITVAGAAQQAPAGATEADLFAEDREIVVARINGKLVDLSTELTDGDTVEPVSIHEEDGLNVLRHSAAHVMAQAVQEYRKDAKLGIGPYITDGVTNITVPRSETIESLTHTRAVELLAEKRAKGPVKRKTAAKKPAAKKKAAEETEATEETAE